MKKTHEYDVYGEQRANKPFVKSLYKTENL